MKIHFSHMKLYRNLISIYLWYVNILLFGVDFFMLAWTPAYVVHISNIIFISFSLERSFECQNGWVLNKNTLKKCLHEHFSCEMLIVTKINTEVL